MINLSAKLHDYAEPSYIDVEATNPFRDGKKDPPSLKKRVFFRIRYGNVLFLTRTHLRHHPLDEKSCQKSTAFTPN
jgi:hypothetical protein